MFRPAIRTSILILKRDLTSSLQYIQKPNSLIFIKSTSARLISTTDSSKSTVTINRNTTNTANSSATFIQHNLNNEELLRDIPSPLLRIPHPKPIRNEIIDAKTPLTTKDLESIDIKINLHRVPVTIPDKIAFNIVKMLRIPTDLFFKKKYIHRSVMLETVAAVPGMVAATVRHLRSLRKMQHDGGWIEHLLHEAENERMHLLTWMRFSQPNIWERALVVVVQGIWYNVFFALYLISPRVAHRIAGYLEEEAIISYTTFLNEIDNGNISNIKEVPDIAIDYWNLDRETATLRDVVMAIRADEAAHRDSNHHFSDRIILKKEDLREDIRRIFAEAKSHTARKIAGLNESAADKWERKLD
ncbi:8125_t:CDS:2 [Ambispora gerdemannii]|uniref:Alternative oxidase n=1 Tax=Ambispora gerdemannii TaxID=144530 RepID=A0A9N9GJZ3_9GLOM|nr:8125_t:CDS:2 [Ambispora gerdemannii]